MEATLLLCDWVEATSGKLYVLGGGWSLMTANQPGNVSLAIKLDVPWDQSNRQIPIRASLVTEDGEQVSFNDQPLLVEGSIEVGRPSGLKPGTALDAVLALRFPGIVLPPGGYSFRFEADGNEIGRVPFQSVVR